MNLISDLDAVEPAARRHRVSTLRLTVIIPTMNREAELADCVRTLLRQTWVPDELIIVDNAQLNDGPIRRMAAGAGVRYTFMRITRPGIARSRNLAVDRATGDIIMFLDDDCLLHSHYVEEVMRVFVEDTGGEVGGACGMGQLRRDRSPGDRLWNLLSTFFRVTGTRRHEGRMLPNGFRTDILHLDEPSDSEYLPGCYMTFRREVFDEDRLDDFFDGYGMGEDKEFSHRVSRKWRLVVTPRARIVHLAASSGRSNFMARGFQMPYNNYYIFKKLMPQTLAGRLMFAWTMLGLVLMNMAYLAMEPTRKRLDELLGMVKGIGHLIWRRPFRHLPDRSPSRGPAAGRRRVLDRFGHAARLENV